MKKQEVMDELAKIGGLRVREVEHSPATRIVVTPDMVTLRPTKGANPIEFTEDGVRNLAAYTGMSQELGKVLSAATWAMVATEMLQHRERYALMLRENKIVALAKPGQYHPFDPERVVNTICRVTGSEEFQRVTILDRQLATAQLEAVGLQEKPVVRGDLVRAGALVTFSPIGTVAPAVQSYVQRLACTNGMTTRTVLKQYSFGGDGDGGSFWSWFGKSLREAVGALDRIVARFQALREEGVPAEQRAEVLEFLLRQAKLPAALAQAIRTRALAEPPQTMYDMLNLMTWATSHLITDPRRLLATRAATEDFAEAEEHARICPVCRRSR